jgi:AAA15 family ATPase/GTPase
LYKSENGYLFVDEIDNGVHYTMLDKFWEVILQTSKKLNVQLFCVTHSKEAIESYMRVAEKLEEADIKFISLYQDRENELKSITFDYEKIQDRIELGLDNR